ncbi:MAG: four helix bundle protein [Bacteroidota bacterium]|nr:four helix bundle protein [Bacteroidota bacterium]
MATGLENLWIYRLAEDLEVKVYEVTKTFPKDELYRSIDQLRRSSSSVSNNPAKSGTEHYHKTTTKEKLRFLGIAKGELEETRRGILKSSRKKFLTKNTATDIFDKYTVLMKGITSYIRFLELNRIEKQQKSLTKTINCN